ncbi:hypothetical protein KXQ82_16720 [Mucilaginibacter sp. HMF5004]|uniref:DUF6438 domain-containing protein n=1 Tax=Mucilaginibacter rivuli TaxID=2857527 RepID=UPI001C5E62AD|nr:DUF6438 domain-containing protein [Mucilaginibacter rivuli]MBW4891374.1 hypothetical protein [Mucilaginibacter rivuli]
MKIFFILLLVGVTLLAKAQTLPQQKVWVSDDRLLYLQTILAYTGDSILVIESMDPARYHNFRGHVLPVRSVSRYTLKTDTLIFKENRMPVARFLIDTGKKGFFILKPMDAAARDVIDRIAPGKGSDKLKFHNLDADYTDTIKFEKILFHSTTCYGPCIPMSIRIDNDKTMKYIRERDPRQHNIPNMSENEKLNALEGSFTGMLSPKLYNSLISILKMSELDKLRANTDRNIDLPTYTLEIWYNHKVWAINSMTMPLAIGPLFNYLMDLPQKIKLERAATDFDVQFTAKPDLGKDNR